MSLPAKSASIDAELEELVLYHCRSTRKLCEQTFGYVKTNDATPMYYSFGTTNALLKASDFVSACSTAASHFGKLIDEDGNISLCIGKKVSIPTSTPKNYQFKEGTIATNPMTANASSGIIIEVAPYYIVVNGLYYSK